VLTNLAIVFMLTIVLSILGVRAGPGIVLAVFSFLWGMVGAIISLQLSRWTAKRAMGVRLVDGRTGHSELDWLYDTVAHLTSQASLPMPEVGIYDSLEVNAFATGPSRNRSLVAVSIGLLRAMRQDEVEGVLAHEVSHIGNGDMVTMTLLQGVINAFVLFFARLIARPGGRSIVIDFRPDRLVGTVTRMGVDRDEVIRAGTTSGFELITADEWPGWALRSGVEKSLGSRSKTQ